VRVVPSPDGDSGAGVGDGTVMAPHGAAIGPGRPNADPVGRDESRRGRFDPAGDAAGESELTLVERATNVTG
jgi:hypothetical protein